MMDTLTSPNLCAFAASAGVLSHLLYFIRGEHHRYPHRWITRILTGVAVLALGLLQFTHYNILHTLALTVALTSSYFTALYTSIAVYRLFLHPLRKFRGPYWAKLSNFYHSYLIRKSDNYLVLQKLHQEYGPIIRMGALPITFQTK